jgi:hypothetical protein
MRIGYLEPYIGCFSMDVAATSISYSECVVVALVIQQGMSRRRIMFSSVTYLAVLYFTTLSHKKHDFRNKLLTCNVCFDFLYNICLKYFMFLREIRDRYYHTCA